MKYPETERLSFRDMSFILAFLCKHSNQEMLARATKTSSRFSRPRTLVANSNYNLYPTYQKRTMASADVKTFNTKKAAQRESE